MLTGKTETSRYQSFYSIVTWGSTSWYGEDGCVPDTISMSFMKFTNSQCKHTIYRGEIQKGAQGIILANFSKTSFAAFLQWHFEAIHI